MNIYSGVQEICLATVGLIFFWSAIAKIIFKKEFKSTLWQIPYLSPVLVPAIYLLLPPLEAAIGTGLIFFLTIAKLAAIALLLSFCFLTIIILKAKLKISCNCFGSSNRSFSKSTIFQNFMLILAIGIGMPVKHAERMPLDIFTGAAVLIIWLSISKLWDNRNMVRKLRRLNIV